MRDFFKILLITALLLLMTFTVVWAQSESATYSLGDIPTTYNTAPNTTILAEQPGLLTVNIPGGAIITGVDIEYDMTAHGGMYMAEQASYIRCTSPGGIAESQVYYGDGFMGGVYNYSRTGLDIANSVAGGGDILFELHGFRIWGGAGTNTEYGYVNNNTWTVTVYFDPVDAGTLEGHVYDLDTTGPVSDVNIQVLGTGSFTTTDASGYFIFPAIAEGTYDVRASNFGYHDQVIENVVVVEDQTTDITFNIEMLDNVTVSGQIVGSDYPTIGLQGAEIFLSGYDNYQVVSGADGTFSIPGVFSNHTYDVMVVMTGYSTYNGEAIVGDTDLDLGQIIVDEVAYPPNTLIATQAPDESQVDLIWNTPLAIDYYFWDFEDGPDDWTSGAITGVDHWELGTPAQTQINTAYSGDNAWMTRLAQDYDNDANTWLMSPELDFSSWQEIHFSAYLNIWSESGWDGMILEASTDGGVTWFHVRSDDTELVFYNNSSTAGPIAPPKWSGRTVGTHGFWDEKATEIPELVGESSVYLRFRFGSDGSVQGEGIAVDDVYIGPEPPDQRMMIANNFNQQSNLTRNGSVRNIRDDLRLLENYNVYRFLDGDEQNEDNWTLIGTAIDTTYTDLSWTDLTSGYYRYGVKAVYTNDVLSEPAISNIVERDIFVTISGTVIGSDLPGVGIADVPVTLTGFNNYSVETDANGYFHIPLVYMFHSYTLTVNAEGYEAHTQVIDVEDESIDLGTIVVSEVAYPPHSVIATQNIDDTEVDLIWNSPLAIDYYFSDFEADDGGWTSGAITGQDHWEWGTPAQAVINSAYSGDNVWMTRLNSNYDNLANTWLQSPEFVFTGLTEPYFSVWLNIQSENGHDSMILESSIDGGNTWIKVRDDDVDLEFYNSATTWGPLPPPKWCGYIGQWQQFSTILYGLENQPSVYLRFRFQTDSSVISEGMAIDDVYVGHVPIDLLSHGRRQTQYFGNTNRVNSDRDHAHRILEDYKVYRFDYEDINNEDNWTELATVADTTYTDVGWNDVLSGFYRYAVKAVYTNDVLSNPSISNWVGKDMTTNVTVNVTTDTGDSAEGAEVKLMYQDQDPDGNSPVYILNATGFDPSVANFLNVLRGTYNLEITFPGFTTYTQNNINIQEITEIDVQIDEFPYPPANLHYTAGSNIVNLMWYPPIVPTRNDAGLSEQISIYEKMQVEGAISKDEAEVMINELINESRQSANSRVRSGRNTRELLGYNIYRNSVQLNTDLLTATTYTDNDVENNVTYTYYVTAVYTLSESAPSNTITVVPGPQQLVLIGDGTTTSYQIPFNYFYRNSLSQTIYMQSEVNAAGLITELQYFSNFVTNLPNMPIKIFMGETTQTNLSGGWIPAGDLELVFDGNVDFLSGEQTISIELDEFFLYTGSSNLVVMAERVMDTTYYSTMDIFYTTVTPDHPDRTRHVFSDGIDYDPYEPPATGTLLNVIPNTGLNIISVGMGTLMGHVYYDNDDPVEGATVTVVDTPFQTQTNNQGYYFFPFVFEGAQTVIASLFGYYDDIVEDLEIIENESITQDFVLSQLPTVTVTGRIVGSDQPDVGLDNAMIVLEGYQYYETTNDAEGFFTIPEVYADHVYDMTIQRSGYQTTTIQIDVGDEDLALGDLTVNELAFPAFNVVASLDDETSEVDLHWSSPDSYQYIDFRYDDGVPITAIGLPTGTDNAVLGTVHPRYGILDSISWYLSGATTHNTVNVFVFALDAQGLPDIDNVLYQSMGVANVHGEWNQLEFPDEIEAPNGFMLGLSAVGNIGIAADDGAGDPYVFQNNTHYYTTDYSTGNWMTMESAGYTNNFLLRAQGFDMGPARGYDPLPLGAVTYSRFGNSSSIVSDSVKLDGYTNMDTTNRNRLIDRDNGSHNSRVLIGYVVYRLEDGHEQLPQNWWEVGTVTDTTHTDTSIDEMMNGSYRYAVRAVYTNNVLSETAFSNTIAYQEFVPNISALEAEVDGDVVTLNWQWVNRSITNGKLTRVGEQRDKRLEELSRVFEGFKITRNGPIIAEGIMETEYIDEGLAAGEYTYTVIGEFTNGATNILSATAVVTVGINDDTPFEPYVTTLGNNYPNPFNPDTKISYSLAEESAVEITIYNIKGQYIATLVNEIQLPGKYEIVWNGRDGFNREVSSGIYLYRMKSGSYTSTKKMIMMK